MNVQILIVADYDVPKTTLEYFEQCGFHYQLTRGPLKTRQILSNQEIDTVLWYSMDGENGLGQDLINIFNQFPEIPVITVTIGFFDKKTQKLIKGFFAAIDIADDKKEYSKLIEGACSQYGLKGKTNTHKENSEPQETDFCNAMQQAVADGKAEDRQDIPPVNVSTPWNALNAREKAMLAEISASVSQIPDKEDASLWNKLRKLFQNE